MSVFRSHRGLSLIEVMIVVVLISTMMVISLPMLSSANAQARSAVCRQNLIDMAGAITSYTVDHHALPAVHELPPHQDGLSLPEFMSPRLQTPTVVFCPSDETEQSQLLQTSYRWSTQFNQRSLADMVQSLEQPLLADREAYHLASATPINELIFSRDKQGFLLTIPGASQDNDAASQKPNQVRFKNEHKRNRKWRDRFADNDDEAQWVD